jgi:hypothetical protein
MSAACREKGALLYYIKKGFMQPMLWFKRLTSMGIYEIPAMLGMIAVAVFCLIQRSFFFSGTVLGASLIAYILAFFLTSLGLKRQGMGPERIFFAVAGAAAARWLFEFIYHYAFPGAIRDIVRDFLNFSTNTSETDFPLIWSVMMIMVVFTGYQYMTVNKWFRVSAAASLFFFLFWILIGYPQWVHPERWPVIHPVIHVIPEGFAHAPDETARTAIINTSLIVNSIAKIAICALLPSLFLNKAAGLGQPRPDARRS